MLLGSRTATPLFGGLACRCPVVRGRGIGFPWLGPSVWWWFENWIVDASENQNLFFVLFFRCDFDSKYSSGVSFRSFCDHFRCDDVSSGVFAKCCCGNLEALFFGFAGCLQGRGVDALADRTDEGRRGQRYASGSRRAGFDPRISEWGNPPALMGRYQFRLGGTQGSETSQYLQERIFRE